MANEFISKLEKLKKAVDIAEKNNVDMGASTDKEKSLYDFKEKRTGYYKESILSALKELNQAAVKLDAKDDNVLHIMNLLRGVNKKNLKDIKRKTSEIERISLRLKPEKTVSEIRIKVPALPADIKADLVADLNEIEGCFKSAYYRSCVILCGRILEVTLHRKYYDVTGQDILEKNPGIGLGTLIAKLREKNVEFDPGITQQIHLINQARVFSVHKKQQVFYPTKAQAHAMILYTMDILEKMF